MRTNPARSISPETAARIAQCAEIIKQQRGVRPSDAQVIGEAVHLLAKHLCVLETEPSE